MHGRHAASNLHDIELNSQVSHVYLSHVKDKPVGTDEIALADRAA